MAYQPLGNMWRSASAGRCLRSFTPLVALLFCGDPAPAQWASAQSAPAQSQPSASEQFQAKIKELARALQANPRLKKLSQQQRENLVEFVTGNMLFVLLHELAHATVGEFHLPVLGRQEDAADYFA